MPLISVFVRFYFYFFFCWLAHFYDVLALDSLDGMREHCSSENWVWRVALPVSSAFRRAAQRSGDWAKLVIDTLVPVLIAHGSTLGIRETAVPGCCNVDTRRKSRNEIRKANAERAVLQTHGTEAETWDGASLTDTAVELPSSTSGEVDLLLQSQLAHKVTSFHISVLPGRIRGRASPWRRVLWRAVLVADAASSDNRVVVDVLRVCGVRELCHASVRDP